MKSWLIIILLCIVCGCEPYEAETLFIDGVIVDVKIYPRGDKWGIDQTIIFFEDGRIEKFEDIRSSIKIPMRTPIRLKYKSNGRRFMRDVSVIRVTEIIIN